MTAADAVTQPARDPLIGMVLDEAYRIESLIAEGGMARVYRGVQLLIDRPVAIKTLRGDRRMDREAHKRFMRELKLSRQVVHPNVVSFIDGGIAPTGQSYMVMEFLDGQTLFQATPERGLDPHTAFELFVQLCDGVEAIHKHGLLHRDLKPTNIFVSQGRKTRRTCGMVVKVLDFGLVRKADNQAAHSLTRERSILGSAGYLAPEQIDSLAPPDQRADIYSMGAIFAFMLTGHNPFAAKSPRAAIGRQLEGPSQVVLDMLPELEDLRELVEQTIARYPAERFENVAALREAVLSLSFSLEGPQQAIELQEARPGRPVESEFNTDAIPLDEEDERALNPIESYPQPTRMIANSIMYVLRSAAGPLSTAEIRDRLRHENELDIDAYVRVLETLADDRHVIAGVGSWRLGRSI